MRAVAGDFSWRPGPTSVATLRAASQDERWQLVLAARLVALHLDLLIEEPDYVPTHAIKYYASVSRLFEDRVSGNPFDAVPMWIDNAVTSCPEAVPTARNFRYQMYSCGAKALIGEQATPHAVASDTSAHNLDGLYTMDWWPCSACAE